MNSHNFARLTLTVRLDSSRKVDYREEKETLCDIDTVHMSASMIGAALRALANEVDPREDERPF